jgi:hypothetical protein
VELEHHVSIMSPLRGPHQRHSNTEFVRAYKQRDYSAIDGRTYAGREAKLWREAVIRLKGGELSVSPKGGDQLGVIRLVAHAGPRVSDATPRAEGGRPVLVWLP